jgi:hypothetical protein
MISYFDSYDRSQIHSLSTVISLFDKPMAVPPYHLKPSTESPCQGGCGAHKALEHVYRNRTLIYREITGISLIFLLFSLTVKFWGEYNQDSVLIEIALIEAWS